VIAVSGQGPRVTLLRDAHVPGGAAGEGRVVPLAKALRAAYGTDVHLQAAVADGRRVTHGDIGQEPIVIECLMLDVDGPEHTPTDEWRAELRGKIEALIEVHPGAFAYETRGGARIVWRLAEPFPITSPADAARWRSAYLGVCAQLEHEHGIAADIACSDFTRLHRAPHATRDHERGPERRPTLGDAFALGVFVLPEAPQLGNTGGPLPQSLPGHDQPHACVAEVASRSILGRLLLARGHVLGVRPLASGPALRVICPNASQHRTHATSKSTDDTAILLPHTGLGSIRCMRTSCRDLGDTWLASFEDDELTAVGVHLLRVRDIYRGNVDAARRERIGVRLVGTDLSERYLRVSVGTGAYAALLAAVHAEHTDEIRIGAWIGATLDEDGRISRTYAVEEPPLAAMLEAAE
jgi:hypothetical protein